jgi:hypothetical protein
MPRCAAPWTAIYRTAVYCIPYQWYTAKGHIPQYTALFKYTGIIPCTYSQYILRIPVYAGLKHLPWLIICLSIHRYHKNGHFSRFIFNFVIQHNQAVPLINIADRSYVTVQVFSWRVMSNEEPVTITSEHMESRRTSGSLVLVSIYSSWGELNCLHEESQIPKLHHPFIHATLTYIRPRSHSPRSCHPHRPTAGCTLRLSTIVVSNPYPRSEFST